MMELRTFIVAFSLIAVTQCAHDADDYEEKWLAEYYEIFETDADLVDGLDASTQNEDDGDKHYFPIPPFTCDVSSDHEPPKSVHELRPSDIKVLAALGDSITAGWGVGADTMAGVPINNRGFSWSIGGNDTLNTSLTLPNIFKNFNQDVTGWSWSRPVILDRNDSHCGNAMYCEQLNVARGGATNRQMKDQAEHLVEKLLDNNKTEDHIDFDNDWKLVTLFIGGNDLCRICNDWDRYSPEVYRDGIKDALDVFHAQLNRTLVQVVLVFDVTPLEDVSTGVVCDSLHWSACPCAKREDSKPLMKGYQMEYAQLVEELVNSGRYDTRDDFTVVVQPHYRDMLPIYTENGEVDNSYWSPDCFHFSQKGHQGTAMILWNVMLMPVGHKPYNYDVDQEPFFMCPTEEHPYIFTNLNSDVEWTSRLQTKEREAFLIDNEYTEEDYIQMLQEVYDQMEADDDVSTMNGEDGDKHYFPIPPFECEVSGDHEPAQTVHQLRPSDVKVLAALGDSITAAFGVGADTLAGTLINNRGFSWSIGGNETLNTSLTLPNIFKNFNENVTGWSWSRPVITDRNDSHCGNLMYCEQLNVAVGGATNRQMKNQAENLVEKLLDNNKTEDHIDFNKDWKIVTLFIGGNDLCRICNNWEEYNPETYREGIQDALDVMHAELNRTLVQVVLIFDISPLENVSTGVSCDAVHRVACPCARRRDSIPLLKGYQMEYARLVEELINSGRYDTRDDFTVVIQPHYRDMEPILTENGEIDNSYFSPDCFHFSQKAHQGTAMMLWNVMLMPVGHKPYGYNLNQENHFSCPTEEHPYIFTNLNSDVFWSQNEYPTKQNEQLGNSKRS